MQDSADIAAVFLNMANIFSEINDYGQALKYLNNCLEYSMAQKDSFIVARCCINIGNVYISKKDYYNADRYFRQALHIFENQYDSTGIATSKISLALCLINKKAFSDASEYLKESINILSIKKEPVFLLIGIHHYGDLLYQKNEYDSAMKYFKRSLDISKSTGFSKYILMNYQMISKVYAKLCIFDSAYYFVDSFRMLNDSIYSLNAKNKINFMNSKYEDEKRNKEFAEYKNDLNLKLFYLVILIVALGFLLIVLLIIYKRFLYSKKMNKTLEEKNLQIENQNIELEKLFLDSTDNFFIISNQNKELEKINNELFESNKTKDKFMSILAHDMLNPLQGLLLTNEVIIKHLENKEYDKVLPKIILSNTNISYINILVVNLLTWSRAHSGRIEPVFSEFQLNGVIENIVNIHIDELKNKSITIKKVIECETAFGDSNMIETVLRNLLSNAIKFSFENDVIIIGTRKYEGKVEIVVSDSGVGMSAEEVESIFKIDRSFSKAGTKNEKGTGFGLLICREFVELNNGAILVDSEPGKGSSFKILLPDIDNNQHKITT